MADFDPIALAALRREYEASGFDESEAAADPFTQFAHWLSAAVEAAIPEPNAMVLSTVGADGPSARTVLLKGLDQEGFSFFTNRNSRKGQQLAAQPLAALVFPWIAVRRQVTARGTVVSLDDAASDAYFAARPRGAQLAAWASSQSQPLANRATLDAAIRQVADRFGDSEIPRPSHWGGYRLNPIEVEFWQGRSDRSHDRLQYQRTDEGWARQRLWP